MWSLYLLTAFSTNVPSIVVIVPGFTSQTEANNAGIAIKTALAGHSAFTVYYAPFQVG